MCLTEIPTGPSPSGVYCTFVEVNGIGLKLYLYSSYRDASLRMQKQLYEHRLAPQPGVEFEIELGGKKYYGHTTEVVTPIVESLPGGDGVYSQYARLPNKAELDAERIALEDQLWEAGFMWDDAHPGNFGRTSDGRLVVIDCQDVHSRGSW